MAKNKLLEAFKVVQNELKAPKNQYNSFGKYNYRSCEDILQAARPLCNDNGLVLTISDEIVQIGTRFYVKATSKVTEIETGESFENVAYAREDDSKKGMDSCQLTGACSSYARKYSLCGLFAIDDTKDADTNEYHQNAQNRPQATQSAKPTTSTKAPAKPTQRANDEARNKAVKALSAEMERMGVTGQEVSAIAGAHIGKVSTKDMTTEEIQTVAKNLETWIFEITKKEG
jgi:phosphatidylserine decarboxylase